jgi:glutaredoxin
MAKEFFKEHNIEYEEKDVAKDLEARKEMIEKSGQLGVPLIEVDGEHVIGFNKEWLKEKLNIK